MNFPFWGPNLQNALDAVGAGANPPGGQGNFGLFQVALASAPALAAIGTATAPALYNPPQSSKLLRIMRVLLGDVSGTCIRENLRYYWQMNPTLSGLTDVSNTIQARSRYVQSVAKFYSALTLGVAPTQFIPVGLGSGGGIAAMFNWFQDQAEGIFVVNPGEIFFPLVSNTTGAGTEVFDVGVVWIETPIVAGN